MKRLLAELVETPFPLEVIPAFRADEVAQTVNETAFAGKNSDYPIDFESSEKFRDLCWKMLREPVTA